MKYPAFFSVVAFCLLMNCDVTAQKKRAPTADQSSFAVGLAPFSLIFPGGKFNVRGEWAYSGNKSLSLLVGIPRPTPVPGLLGNMFDVEDDASVSINRFTSYGAVLEHRFYTGQNAPRGFYFAPYARYNNFSLKRTTQNDGSPYKTAVKGAVGGFGLGAAAGVQFRLGDYLTLDATLAGVDFKWLTGSFTYSTDDPETDLSAFRDKVEETVGDIPLVGSRLDVEIDGNAVKVRTPGLLMPAYRFNLTVNYVF